MTYSLKTPNHSSPPSHQAEWVGFVDSPFTAAIPHLDLTKGTLATRLHDCVRLDWEELQCFERVSHQFKEWGVMFANAIALQPSNSAYPPRAGAMVLMGAPRDGWLEATFLRPVKFVSGFVTSPRRTILTAFDHNDEIVLQTESSGSNLANSGIYPPNIRLSVSVPNIHRVTFHTFSGHLTLDEFCFSYS